MKAPAFPSGDVRGSAPAAQAKSAGMRIFGGLLEFLPLAAYLRRQERE
jgi:hypothetical protein